MKPNPGWFKKGPDPRRHALTLEEKRRGGLTFAQRYGVVFAAGEWLNEVYKKRRAS